MVFLRPVLEALPGTKTTAAWNGTKTTALRQQALRQQALRQQALRQQALRQRQQGMALRP